MQRVTQPLSGREALSMRIESIRTLDGPNVFHALPVLTMYLRLEDLTDTYSNEVPGFPRTPGRAATRAQDPPLLPRLRRWLRRAVASRHVLRPHHRARGAGDGRHAGQSRHLRQDALRR